MQAPSVNPCIVDEMKHMDIFFPDSTGIPNQLLRVKPSDFLNIRGYMIDLLAHGL